MPSPVIRLAVPSTRHLFDVLVHDSTLGLSCGTRPAPSFLNDRNVSRTVGTSVPITNLNSPLTLDLAHSTSGPGSTAVSTPSTTQLE